MKETKTIALAVHMKDWTIGQSLIFPKEMDDQIIRNILRQIFDYAHYLVEKKVDEYENLVVDGSTGYLNARIGNKTIEQELHIQHDMENKVHKYIQNTFNTIGEYLPKLIEDHDIDERVYVFMYRSAESLVNTLKLTGKDIRSGNHPEVIHEFAMLNQWQIFNLEVFDVFKLNPSHLAIRIR